MAEKTFHAQKAFDKLKAVVAAETSQELFVVYRRHYSGWWKVGGGNHRGSAVSTATVLERYDRNRRAHVVVDMTEKTVTAIFGITGIFQGESVA
jgi:hypothetical protein